MNPRNVVKCTRLVEVQDEVRREHVACIVAHHHRSPGGLTRCLHAPFQSGGIGCEVRDQRWLYSHCSHFLCSRYFEVHGGIVDACSLVDVDVESAVGFHLQCRLHTIGNGGLRSVTPDDGIAHIVLLPRSLGGNGCADAGFHLRKARGLHGIFLCVVVAGLPPCRMVAG